MITIKKESFSLMLSRRTIKGEKLTFNKLIEQDYIKFGYADEFKQTKEKKVTIKKK